MSRSRDLADLGGVTTRLDQVGNSEGALSNRNMVLNGSMAVAQRGTSQTNSSYGSVDRWYIYSSGGTFTQETSSPPEGFSRYLTCTSATGSVIVSQAIELPATGSAGVFYNGQTITISYYAKSTSAGDALYNPISFRNGITNTTDLVSVESDSSDTNVLTTSWARYSKTYTIGVNLNSNNTCLVIQPRTSGAPSGDISITGVQLELGDTATPFEHISYGDQLQKCQRYFFKLEGVHNARLGIGGYVVGATEARFDFILPVSMRAVPTLSGSGTASFDASTDSADFTITNMVINSPPAGTITGLGLQIATSGMVAGQAGGLRLRSAGSSLTLDSEL